MGSCEENMAAWLYGVNDLRVLPYKLPALGNSSLWFFFFNLLIILICVPLNLFFPYLPDELLLISTFPWESVHDSILAILQNTKFY